MITTENWNYTFYKNQDLKSFIAWEYATEHEITERYLVNIVDLNDNDIYQKSFIKLDDACRYINKKYSHLWSLESSMNSGTGCSSCVAH